MRRSVPRSKLAISDWLLSRKALSIGCELTFVYNNSLVMISIRPSTHRLFQLSALPQTTHRTRTVHVSIKTHQYIHCFPRQQQALSHSGQVQGSIDIIGIVVEMTFLQIIRSIVQLSLLSHLQSPALHYTLLQVATCRRAF